MQPGPLNMTAATLRGGCAAPADAIEASAGGEMATASIPNRPEPTGAL